MAFVYGTNGNDHITPNYNNGPYFYADAVYLYDGHDYVNTSSGDDYIDGGAGNDTVDAGDGADQIQGGGGDDRLNGDLGNDLIRGGEGNDIINGGLSDDLLHGDAGNDTFLHTGADGWDNYYGGTGYDVISLAVLHHAAIWGQIKINTITDIEAIVNSDISRPVDILVKGSADFSNVSITNIRHILGQGTNDYILGNAGNNWIKGDAGNDHLYGNAGNDTIEGGTGNDNLTGGAGTDQFVFTTDQSTDVVTDFVDGEDRVRLATGTDVQITEQDGNATLVLDSTTYVVLQGVTADQIDSTDFLFG